MTPEHDQEALVRRLRGIARRSACLSTGMAHTLITWLVLTDSDISDTIAICKDEIDYAQGQGCWARAGPGGPGGFGPQGHVFFKKRGPGPAAGGGCAAATFARRSCFLLDEEPRNGYQVMQEIEQRSEGAWRPSPGSVYPAFQLLADEGLVRGEARDGGNVFKLTDAGRAYVEENREKLGNPWQQAGEGMPRRRARADAPRDAGRDRDPAGRRTTAARRSAPRRQGARRHAPRALPDPRRGRVRLTDRPARRARSRAMGGSPT